jgi:hypothetical protein
MAGTEARVFESLERAGVFLAGGVVVGSHAFALYSNMLGVKWNTHSTRTQDIDIASDNIIKIGAIDKQVDLKETILQSGLGFFEAPTLNRKEVSTTFAAKGKQLRVDVLTPMLGRMSSEPVYLASLKTMAQPVRFLDYLLENIQPAIIVSKSGILVNTPSPARFALHKLVVSQRRLPAFHTKSKKDINQAEQLLTVLVDERPGDILLALEAIKELPNKFNQQLKSGMRHLTPDLQREMKELMDS